MGGMPAKPTLLEPALNQHALLRAPVLVPVLAVRWYWTGSVMLELTLSVGGAEMS